MQLSFAAFLASCCDWTWPNPLTLKPFPCRVGCRRVNAPCACMQAAARDAHPRTAAAARCSRARSSRRAPPAGARTAASPPQRWAPCAAARPCPCPPASLPPPPRRGQARNARPRRAGRPQSARGCMAASDERCCGAALQQARRLLQRCAALPWRGGGRATCGRQHASTETRQERHGRAGADALEKSWSSESSTARRLMRTAPTAAATPPPRLPLRWEPWDPCHATRALSPPRPDWRSARRSAAHHPGSYSSGAAMGPVSL